jgi:hypothetical protein
MKYAVEMGSDTMIYKVSQRLVKPFKNWREGRSQTAKKSHKPTSISF